MESHLSPSARHQLDRFSRQYLQVELALDYPDEECLRNDAFQQCLYTRVFRGDINHSPPQRYQLRVLKLLTQKIEHSIHDWDEEGISDDIMNSLSSLLCSSVPTEPSSAQEKSYVTYTLSSLCSTDQDPPSISLLESRNLLAAAGTTGLRTWEASLHLGEYLCSNSHLVKGSNVLELGAGTAYISILCAKYLGASRVVATDGSEEVISSLSDNFHLNRFHDTTIIEGKELRWGETFVNQDFLGLEKGQKIDVVLGADVTYDETAISALVSTFGHLFELFPDVKIIIAATVRNTQTLDSFLKICQTNKNKVEQMAFCMTAAPSQMGPFYPDTVPIQPYLITRF